MFIFITWRRTNIFSIILIEIFKKSCRSGHSLQYESSETKVYACRDVFFYLYEFIVYIRGYHMIFNDYDFITNFPYQIYTSFKYTTFGEFVKGYYSHFRYEHWNALLTIVIIPIAKMRDIMSIADSRYPANHAPWVFSYSSWTHICVSLNMRKSKCMVMAKEIDWENDAFQSTCCILILNVLLILMIYNFAKKWWK